MHVEGSDGFAHGSTNIVLPWTCVLFSYQTDVGSCEICVIYNATVPCRQWCPELCVCTVQEICIWHMLKIMCCNFGHVSDANYRWRCSLITDMSALMFAMWKNRTTTFHVAKQMRCYPSSIGHSWRVCRHLVDQAMWLNTVVGSGMSVMLVGDCNTSELQTWGSNVRQQFFHQKDKLSFK